MRKNKGITMAALIVTIVVMLILLTVSIEIVINGDIIGTTKQAKNETNNKVAEQAGKVADMMEKWDDVTDGKYPGLTTPEKTALQTAGGTEKRPNNVSKENLKDTTKIKTVITDADGGEVPIPVGATYIEGTESTGVVILYKGSQFVWVPVPNVIYDSTKDSYLPKDTTAGSLTEGHNYTPMAINTGTEESPEYKGLVYYYDVTNGAYLLYPSSSPYQGTSSQNREPAVLTHTTHGDWATDADRGLALIKTYITGYSNKETADIKTDWANQLQNEYNLMVESVSKYGGFYVGRYETSINATTGVASIAGVLPMNANTTPAETAGGTWYGMYQKQKDFSGSGTDTMQSSMIWGSQYDAMLNWILMGENKDRVVAKNNGNHSGNPVNTGTTLTDRINNIYDLEGNLYEWTLGASNTYRRSRRGSFYGAENAAYFSTVNVPYSPSETETSRLTLYIK